MKNKENTIPKGWQIKTIDQVCYNLDNLRVPISKDKRIKGSIPYYGATGVLDYVAEYIFDEELLLIGEDGADWSRFAESAYLIKGKSWVNNHAHVLKCKKINQVYLKEYLNFKDLNLYITGGTRGKLTKGILSKIPVAVPTPEEQKKIAEILACVDEDIEKTDEIIKNMQKLKMGLMQELFTHGVGHIKFRKTKLGEIPEEWEIKNLKDISNKIGDGLHGTPEYSNKSNYYFINGNNISDKKINIYSETKCISLEEYELYKKELSNKSILLSINGTIGNVGFYNNEKVALGKSIAYINCNKDTSEEFIAYQLETDRVINSFMKGLTGTTIKNLSLATIRQTPVFIPNIKEQKKIAEILSAIDDKVDIYKQIKLKLTELKKGLMQDLLSGEVRVTN